MTDLNPLGNFYNYEKDDIMGFSENIFYTILGIPEYKRRTF